MLRWVAPLMWDFCDIVGYACTITSLIGLLAFLGHGLMWISDKIIEME